MCMCTVYTHTACLKTKLRSWNTSPCDHLWEIDYQLLFTPSINAASNLCAHQQCSIDAIVDNILDFEADLMASEAKRFHIGYISYSNIPIGAAGIPTCGDVIHLRCDILGSGSETTATNVFKKKKSFFT